MRRVNTALRLAFLEAQLGIEDDPKSPNFGWLCVQSPALDHWVLIADLKPHADMFQATLLGWTQTEWESAMHDVLVWHATHATNVPMQEPRTVAAARQMMLQWFVIAGAEANPGNHRPTPKVMSGPLFDAIRADLERNGMLTGGRA